MAESFSVGEIAIVCGYVDHPEFVGCEVEIAGPLGEYAYKSAKTGRLGRKVGYRVMRSDGFAIYSPHNLRKKPALPTREQTSTWDDVIVWKPREKSHV